MRVMSTPHDVTRSLEQDLTDYTGSSFACVVNSCTNALQLAMMWERWRGGPQAVEIPRRTYVGVAHAVINAGHQLKFRNDDWSGIYKLEPFELYDCARRFRRGMYLPGSMMCVSFHISKICGFDQGGAILFDDPDAFEFLHRARFDGRAQGVAPKDDEFAMPAMHCYLSPTIAAGIRWKLSTLPDWNEDLLKSDYPDLSEHRWFHSSLRAMKMASKQGGKVSLNRVVK